MAAITYYLLSFGPHGIEFSPYHLDLDVYRIGGLVWRHGGDLYGRLPATSAGPRLSFTYPPAAAILLSPLTLVPMTVAATVLTLATIALVAAVLRMFAGVLAWPPANSRWLAAWLLPPALFLEPVRSTLAYGQVNVVLMALITADCLADAPRWPRGAMTGLAAAVKLTPLAFVLFFLVRRDYRAAGTAVASFLATTGAGFLLAGRDSVQYWTRTVFQVGRIGSPAYAGNQSIVGVLARAGLGSGTPAGTAAWLVLSAIVVVTAWCGMRHAVAADVHAWALSLNAFAALLISPISWSHHWVWGIPAVLTLAACGRRRRARLPMAAAVTGVAVFAAAPQWWFPAGANRELGWAPWQQAIGSAYVIYAALVLLLPAGALLPARPAGPAKKRSSPGRCPCRAAGAGSHRGSCAWPGR
jgi:alpha-1,2-mannosyltransferase